MGLDTGGAEWTEERKALDVVHVQVREQDVDPPQRCGERRATAADARSGVEHEHGAIGRAYLDTRGVGP